MFNGETVTSLIFRLLNFGVLIAFFVYIFKRSVLADIIKNITSTQERLHTLKTHRDNLKNQLKALEHTAQEQEKLSKELALKVARWQDVFSTKVRHHSEQNEHIRRFLITKTELQSKTIALHKVQKVVFPKVIMQSQEQLEQKFASEQAGEEFINSLLVCMEKGKR